MENGNIHVPLWHRKNKTNHPARAWLWLAIAALYAALFCSDKVVFDLDGTTLTIRKEAFCGLLVREERMPASDIVEYRVETERRLLELCERKSLCILGKGGKFLMHKLGNDAVPFRDGLEQALQKRPVGTFRGEHRNVDVLAIVAIIMLLVAAWHDGVLIPRRKK